MYDLRTKQAKILANDKSKNTHKSDFFRKETKNLISQGMERVNARIMLRSFFCKTSKFSKDKKVVKAEWAGISSRRTRRERNRKIKVPYNPIYNGPFYVVEWSKDEKGKDIKNYIAIS